MEKVTLEYDSSTGELKDATGNFVANYIGLVSFDEVKVLSVKEVISLKAEGFEADELVEMRKQNLI